MRAGLGDAFDPVGFGSACAIHSGEHGLSAGASHQVVEVGSGDQAEVVAERPVGAREVCAGRVDSDYPAAQLPPGR